MRKVFVLLAVVAVVAVPASAQVSGAAGAAGVASFSPPEAPAIVLYDQTANPSGNGAPDQDFEAAFDAYDSEAADDFEVTFPDGWTIEGVNTIGTNAGIPASVDLWFYGDNGGLPAATAECEYLGIATGAPDSLALDISGNPCILAPGTYWVSVQVNQDFGGGGGQHFWSSVALASTTGNPGVWRNPGDGFGTGCLDWTAQSTCGVGGGVGDDWLFQIIGTEGGLAVNPLEVPTVNTIGLAVLALLLVGATIVLMRRRREV